MKWSIVLAAIVILLEATTAAAAPEIPGGDEVLAALLRRAEESSPALARARAAVAAGRAGIDGARTRYRPTIGVSERFTSTDNAPSAFALTLDQGRFTSDLIAGINDPPRVEDWETSLYARIVLYDFDQRGAGLRAAKAEATRREMLEVGTWRDVRYQVTHAYHDLTAARAAVGLWEETVRLIRAHEQLTLAQYESGKVLRSDLLSIGVRLSEAEENLIAARNAAHVGLVRLASVIGVSGPDLEVPDREPGTPVFDLDEDVVVEAALTGNPALDALDAGIVGANSSERAAARGNWPSLTAEARGIWHGEDESFGVERGSYVAAVMLDVPLFDAGRSEAARRLVAAERGELEAARRETAQALELAAREAYRRTTDAVARIAIADRATVAAGEALSIIEERYGAGLAKVVDLIEVQRALTHARVRALDARTQAWKAIASVELVTGSEVFR